MNRHTGTIPSLLKTLASCFFVSAIVLGCPRNETPDPLQGAGGEHLLRIVQISDTQIVDEESPARLVRFAPITQSAWRPQEAYDIQTLDATLRVINQHAALAKSTVEFPIDFVIATGDLSDGCQHNELRWFIDTMDGQDIVPDSGAPDGADRDQAPEDNPKLSYDAEGLDPSIPWYTVFGNHDGLSAGVFGIDRSAANPSDWFSPVLPPLGAIIGLHAFGPESNELAPVSDLSPAVIRGSEDVAHPDSLRLDYFKALPGTIVADSDRRFSSREHFIAEHFNSSTAPAGHGFAEANVKNGHVWYSVRPKEDVPVRLLVLDTVAPAPLAGLPTQYGVLSREQFEDFLRPEILAAQKAGEWVLIASHHPSEDFDLPYNGPHVGTTEFRTFLSEQSNIVAHICGHTHRNFVRLVEGTNPYYEIETGSITDYPQEGRILDIYFDEKSNAIRITSQMISHMEDPTILSAESFRRAEIDAENHGAGVKDADAEAMTGALKAAGINAWPEAQLSKEERLGKTNDRVFDVTFRRN
jgi:3',5'-cyclic AMP phosphodiesterase CpdA